MLLFEKYSLVYHKTLNQKLFNGEKLREDVRQAFLRIGKEFANFADIPNDYITDIIFTGGNCNYNYSRFSDCDVHIVFDRNSMSHDDRLVYNDRLFSKVKALWSFRHHIKVKGYSVELYAQPSDDELVASGVYSVSRDGWIKKPIHGSYNFNNDAALEKKVEGLKKTLDTMIESGVGLPEFKVMKEKLKAMRSAALAGGDEFSFDNLVFKALRNTGVLERVNRYLSKLQDRELSL